MLIFRYSYLTFDPLKSAYQVIQCIYEQVLKYLLGIQYVYKRIHQEEESRVIPLPY